MKEELIKRLSTGIAKIESAKLQRGIPDPVDVVTWWIESKKGVMISDEDAFIEKCKKTQRIYEACGEENLRKMYREYMEYKKDKEIRRSIDSINPQQL